jgi:hypothetical protein
MKIYGINKILYETEIRDGILFIYIKHTNKEFRKRLDLHREEPKILFDMYHKINNNNPKAKYWFFELLNDNKKYFIDERIKLIF